MNKEERIINKITFFGDSAIPEGDKEYQDAYETAKLLALNGYTIVNGGGPGIMEAATSGAESVNGQTKAIYWEPKLASYFEGKNISNITDESETYSNYIMRTLGLIENGDVFIVFKGGTGTISEFGMVWCIGKLYFGCHKPVILFGEFWDDVLNAIQKNMYIDQTEMSVLHKATTPEQVLELIESFQVRFRHCLIKNKSHKSDEESLIIGNNKSKDTVIIKDQNKTRNLNFAGSLVSQTQIDEFASLVFSPAQVLTLGCNSSQELIYLSQKYSVTNVNADEGCVNMLEFDCPEVKFRNIDFSKENLEKEVYKGIWARDFLNTLNKDEIKNVFRQVYEALVEGGVFYFIVREGEGEVEELTDRFSMKKQKKLHLFSTNEIVDLAQEIGFKIKKIDHMKRSHYWLIGVLYK